MEYSRRPTKSIPKENQLKILNKIYQTYLVSTTDGIIVNRCPRSPWVKLLLSQSWRRIFTWHLGTLQNFSTSPSEKAQAMRTEQYLQWLKAGCWLAWLSLWFQMIFLYSDGWKLNVININVPCCLWVIGEISAREKEGCPVLDKSDGRPEMFVRGSRGVF